MDTDLSLETATMRAARWPSAIAALAVATVFISSACAVHAEEHEHHERPFDDRANEVFQGVYDCTEHNDTGYRSGDNFPIKVVSVDAKPVEVKTANAYIAMQARARTQGVQIRIVSGFRTMDQQEFLYACYVNCNCNSCNLAARPGYSNHQSGHALDLNTADAGVLNWLNSHGDEFGFARTVPSEDWHWEYWGAVGFEGPCGQPPTPHECETGNFDGEFCDDDGTSSEGVHDRLKLELGVDFHCADVAGQPAFCAGKDATRAQAMFVLGEAADIPLAGHPDGFVDDDGHAREAYLDAAKVYGVLRGTDNGTRVNPDGLATRNTLATMLDRIYLLPPTDVDYFDDDDGTASEATHNRVAAAGLFTGYADDDGGRKDFRGSTKANRSTLAILATRAKDRGLVPIWSIPLACMDGEWSGVYCDDDGAAQEPDVEWLVHEAHLDVQRGTLAGSPAYRLGEHASRAEALYVLAGAAAMPLRDDPDAFADDDEHPREAYLNAAKTWGVFQGYAGGTEGRPDAIASRTTLAIVLGRIYALPEASEDFFSDDDGTSAEGWHNKAASAGLFQGFDDGHGGREFRGDVRATRADLATLAGRARDAALVAVWAQGSTSAPGTGNDDPADASDASDASDGVEGDIDDPAPSDDVPFPDEAAAVAGDPEGRPNGLAVFDERSPSVRGGTCAALGDSAAVPAALLWVLAARAQRRRPRRRETLVEGVLHATRDLPH